MTFTLLWDLKDDCDIHLLDGNVLLPYSPRRKLSILAIEPLNQIQLKKWTPFTEQVTTKGIQGMYASGPCV